MQPYYHSTTKKLITIFGALFDDIEISMSPDRPEKTYKVPIRISTREKFLTLIMDNVDNYSASTAKQTVWLAFDFVGMNYAAERATNNTKKIAHTAEKDNEQDYMLNRVPYDLNFELYISSKQVEHSFMIIEQIIPQFKPSLNVVIDEIDDFNLKTDISVTLNSVSPDIQSEGAFTEQRTILWTLQFSMKAYYYPRINKTKRIKESITNIYNNEALVNDLFAKFVSEVVPREANRDEPHEIVSKTEYRI